MIYLIDRGFRIKSALNILVNQCKYPGIYNECFCLSCNVNVNDNDNVNVNDNDLRSSFANNVNDNDNVIDNENDNDNANDSDNDIDIDNDLRSSFANIDNVNDNDNFIYLLEEKHGETWVKPHQRLNLIKIVLLTLSL